MRRAFLALASLALAACSSATVSAVPSSAPSAAASPGGACTLELTHVESDRAFHYRIRVTGLEPGTPLPRIEFLRGPATFSQVSSEDDPEARIDDTGTFEGGINLDDSEVPLTTTGDWMAKIVEPATCAGTTSAFDPLEFRD